MTRSDDTSLSGKMIAFASSTSLGLALLAVVTVYLGVASVAAQLAPDWLFRILGRSGPRVYSHPAFLAPLALLCVNIFLATLTRVRFDGPRLGTHLCHWGVLLLAAGASWYWLAGLRGDCVSIRMAAPDGQAHWTPVDKFFLEGSFAVYARCGDRTQGLELPDLSDARRGELNAAFTAPDGRTVRVRRYLPAALLQDRWSDNSPTPSPAVEVRITDGQPQQFVLSPQYEENHVADLGAYMVMYQPRASLQAMQELMTAEFPELHHRATMLLIAGDEKGALHLLVLPSTGQRQDLDLVVGPPAKFNLDGRPIELQLVRKMDHAMRRLEATPASPAQVSLAVPGVEVEIAASPKPYRTFLPFVSYPELAPWQAAPTSAGAELELIFSRQVRPLPGSVAIEGYEFQTYDGTVMPKDYICQVRVEQAGRSDNRTLSLNHPIELGPYQLSQSSWRPSGPEPQQIVWGVASRPGVGLVYLAMAMIVAGLLWAFYVKPFLLRRKIPTSLPAWLAATAGAAVLLAPCATAQAQELFDAPTVQFLRQLDAQKLSTLPVQTSGRIAVMDTLAREQLAAIYGDEEIQNLPPAAAWLELYFNSGAYLDRDTIYVKEKPLRPALAKTMAPTERASFERSHRLKPATLLNADACEFLYSHSRASMADFERAADRAPSLDDALAELAQQGNLRLPLENLISRQMAFLGEDALRMIPARGGHWSAVELDTALPTPTSFPTSASASVPTSAPANSAADEISSLVARWAKAWRNRDIAAVNALTEQLDRQIRVQADEMGETAPSGAMTQVELFYNRTYKATAVWIGFALATLAMIAAAASHGRRFRRIGMTLLSLSTLALLAGFIARWALSGRAWYLPPIMNQFEAVLGSALLAAAAGLALEWISKRNYYGLAAALYATLALLAGFFLPQQMGAGIGPTAGILASPVMAVHVAVIIVGHALAGMTCFISVAYLLTALRGEKSRPTLDSIDRCNEIVVQLATWTIVLGTFLGAYWADFAWGRWWGWDVKEVWAMMTALAFIGVVHIRLVVPSRHRGWLTAVLCLLATGIMLFNWVGVNYFLRGLHSYA